MFLESVSPRLQHVVSFLSFRVFDSVHLRVYMYVLCQYPAFSLARSQAGLTALDRAVANNHTDVVQLISVRVFSCR